MVRKTRKIGTLQAWCHEVLSPSISAPIAKEHLEDATIYISRLDKYHELQIEWNKVIPQYLEEFKSHKTRIRFIPVLDPIYVKEILEKVKELTNKFDADKEGEVGQIVST